MKPILPVMFSIYAAFCGVAVGQQDTPEFTVSLDNQNGRVTVNASCGNGCSFGDRLSFSDSYADSEGLAGRISSLKLFAGDGNEVAYKRFGSGDFVADEQIKGLSYVVNAGLPVPLIAAPHVSWFQKDRALIKLYDLLPNFYGKSISVKFKLPDGWLLNSVFEPTSRGTFELSSYGNSVFLASPDARTLSGATDIGRVSFSILDDWQFEDETLPEMSNEILSEYSRLLGNNPYQRVQINLIAFPAEIGTDRWRAETQAGTITIVSSQTAFENQAPQRLHEQLRHELFHLWIPGKLRLKGDYSWFYEGFARYQSLKTGVWTGRITFDDYLRSMSESISIAASDESGLSLVERSNGVWTRNQGIAAAKGMSIAFLCDALILEDSKGKRSVSDLLKSFIINNSKGETTPDGNEAVIAELNRHDGLKTVVSDHITGNSPIDWSKPLSALGLEQTVRHRRSIISVVQKPNRRQRALLDKLGYNRWKKFAPGR